MGLNSSASFSTKLSGKKNRMLEQMIAMTHETRKPGHQAPTHWLEWGVRPEESVRSVWTESSWPPTTYPRAGPTTNQVWKMAM